MYKKVTSTGSVSLFYQKSVFNIEEIKQTYQKGINYFYTNEDNLALEAFKSVLKNFPCRSPIKSISSKISLYKYELLGAVYLIGKIYLKNTEFFNNYAKAAGIFQYCKKFSKIFEVKYYFENKEVDFLKEAHLVEKVFLSSNKAYTINILTSLESNAEYPTKSQEYKSNLERIRSHISHKLSEIDETPIKNIQDRSKTIENICGDCTKFFVNKNIVDEIPLGFTNLLIHDCFNELGRPPLGCTYAIIGLGSLATSKMTPWSDLEFAVLINENNTVYKEYFRKLIKLLHIKVVNIGETPLRTLGIKELNDFQSGSEENDWFWDGLTKNAFCFDGQSIDACKTPLGRNGSYKQIKQISSTTEKYSFKEKRDFELILTPNEMIEFQKQNYLFNGQESWFESDKYLVLTLRSTILIDGNSDLLSDYRKKLSNTPGNNIHRLRVLEIMREDINSFSLKLRDDEEGKLIDVKKDIFRIADRLIDGLVLYYKIEQDHSQEGFTPWKAIDLMSGYSEEIENFEPLFKPSEITDKISRKRPLDQEKDKILSKIGAKHLKEALSIACELRLHTYSSMQEQSQNISTYEPATPHLSDSQTQKLIEETFYIQDTALLHYFYYIILRLQQILTKFCNDGDDKETKTVLREDDLIDGSDYAKAMVHSRFLEYEQALKYMKQSYSDNLNDTDFLIDMYLLHFKTGKIESAINILQQVLVLQEKSMIEGNSFNIAATHNDLGNAYQALGNYDMAIEYYNSALEIYNKFYENIYNSSIARIYHNLSACNLEKGNYVVALTQADSALEIKERIYPENHPSIGKTYANIGNIFQALKDYDQAISSHNKTLEIFSNAYKKQPNHPLIAKSYGNIGGIFHTKEEYNLAKEYYELSLEIYNIAYKNNQNHQSIANIYSNLSYIFFAQGSYDEAVIASNKAINIYLALEKSGENEDLAKCNNVHQASLFQLGNHAFLAGKQEEANNYYKHVSSEFDYTNIKHFVALLEQQRNLACKLNSKLSAINCQLMFLKIDSGFVFGNHYHNLASFYASKGDIIDSLHAFNKALDINVSSSLYVDYAQFLILNSKNLPSLEAISEKISYYLHKAIELEDDSVLKYKKLHKDSITPVLKRIMEQTKSTLEINPKILSYYFLIKHGIYRSNNDNIEKLFELFSGFCKTIQDHLTSKILLSDLDIYPETLITEQDDYPSNLSRQVSFQSGVGILFSQCLSNAGDHNSQSQMLNGIDALTQESEVIGKRFNSPTDYNDYL